MNNAKENFKKKNWIRQKKKNNALTGCSDFFFFVTFLKWQIVWTSLKLSLRGFISLDQRVASPYFLMVSLLINFSCSEHRMPWRLYFYFFLYFFPAVKPLLVDRTATGVEHSTLACVRAQRLPPSQTPPRPPSCGQTWGTVAKNGSAHPALAAERLLPFCWHHRTALCRVHTA